MNIEKVCRDAIKVVEKYLAGDLIAADMYDELQEAQDAADDAWDEANRIWCFHITELDNNNKPVSSKSNRICRAAWHACLAAKNDERSLAKMYVNGYWELV